MQFLNLTNKNNLLHENIHFAFDVSIWLPNTILSRDNINNNSCMLQVSCHSIVNITFVIIKSKAFCHNLQNR